MGFWIFMLVMDLIIPAAMIGCGRFLQKKPPKSINATFGYRTTRSMKSQEAWDFAQTYCGRLWVRLGLALLPLSVIPLLVVLGRDMAVIGNTAIIVAAVQLIPFLGSIIPVERALKRTFDENGAQK